MEEYTRAATAVTFTPDVTAITTGPDIVIGTRGKTRVSRLGRSYIVLGKRQVRSLVSYDRRTRLAALELLGGKCVKCGINDWRVLQVDHINGGGNREYLKTGYGARFHRKLIDGILHREDYQLLCANCNWIKRYEENECGRTHKWS